VRSLALSVCSLSLVVQAVSPAPERTLPTQTLARDAALPAGASATYSGVSSAAPVPMTLAVAVHPSGWLAGRIAVGLRGVTATFATAQRYDVVLRKPNGKIAYRLSDAIAYAPSPGVENFNGSCEWTFSIPRFDLKPGRYVAEAWITSADLPHLTAIATVDLR